ncbi:MAG TPA: class I SAM-dependent methyltransferase, partial [Terriglobia bacterium]|nr:class I SAM-dependent methyltransferase [Terriglobia bacterium]
KEPLRALQEMARVQKPEGITLIIDMNAEATNREIDQVTKSMGVKGLEALFMKLTFRYFLRKGSFAEAGFNSLIRQTDFKNSRIFRQNMMHHVYLEKSESLQAS